MVVTKFSRQKLMRFWAFRLTHPYQSHYSFMWDILPWICFSRTCLDSLRDHIDTCVIILLCVIFFHGFVFLELALILFEIILTHACMNMIKALFVISYISQIAYLVINFSLCWTPFSFIVFFFFYCEPTLQALNPKNNAFTQAVELVEHCSSLWYVWMCKK